MTPNPVSKIKIKKFEKLKADLASAKSKLEQYRNDIIRLGCPHPTEYARKFWKDVDNGYGVWWKIEVVKCSLCGEQL